MNERTITFQTPTWNRFGDAVLVLLLLPIGVGALLFLSLVLGAVLVTGLHLQHDLLLAGLLGGAVVFPLLCLVPRPQSWWSIRLEAEGIKLLGPMGITKVSYEQVLFLRVGRMQEFFRPLWARRSLETTVPIIIEVASRHSFNCRLSRPDAAACLLELHRRSERAAAVDADGRSYLPRRQTAVPEARQRLARFWNRAGALAGAGATLFGILGAAILVQYVRQQMDLSRFLWTLIGALLFAERLLKARRHSLDKAHALLLG